jgi:hypothetical protein
MQQTMEVLGIAGSLRRDSYNKALLRAAQQLAPAGMLINIYGTWVPFHPITLMWRPRLILRWPRNSSGVFMLPMGS